MKRTGSLLLILAFPFLAYADPEPEAITTPPFSGPGPAFVLGLGLNLGSVFFEAKLVDVYAIGGENIAYVPLVLGAVL
jgi:hypothetical protein